MRLSQVSPGPGRRLASPEALQAAASRANYGMDSATAWCSRELKRVEGALLTRIEQVEAGMDARVDLAVTSRVERMQTDIVKYLQEHLAASSSSAAGPPRPQPQPGPTPRARSARSPPGGLAAVPEVAEEDAASPGHRGAYDVAARGGESLEALLVQGVGQGTEVEACLAQVQQVLGTLEDKAESAWEQLAALQATMRNLQNNCDEIGAGQDGPMRDRVAKLQGKVEDTSVRIADVEDALSSLRRDYTAEKEFRDSMYKEFATIHREKTHIPQSKGVNLNTSSLNRSQSQDSCATNGSGHGNLALRPGSSLRPQSEDSCATNGSGHGNLAVRPGSSLRPQSEDSCPTNLSGHGYLAVRTGSSLRPKSEDSCPTSLLGHGNPAVRPGSSLRPHSEDGCPPAASPRHGGLRAAPAPRAGRPQLGALAGSPRAEAVGGFPAAKAAEANLAGRRDDSGAGRRFPSPGGDFGNSSTAASTATSAASLQTTVPTSSAPISPCGSGSDVRAAGTGPLEPGGDAVDTEANALLDSLRRVQAQGRALAQRYSHGQ